MSDEDKLGDLLESTDATEKGEQSGAKIYDASGTEFAVDGDTVVFAGSRKLLNEALARHDGDDTLDEDTFNSNLEDVGDDGIAQGYVNVQSLLSGSEGARNARKVKWIGAIEGIGLNATVEGDAINVDFKIRTDPSGLTDADLPIASGPEAPAIVERPGEIGVGVRDIGQIVSFVETVAQAVVPVRLRRLRRGQDADRAATRRGRGEGHPRPALRRHLGQHLARGQVRRARRAQGSRRRSSERSGRSPARCPTLAEGLGLDDVSLVRPKAGEDLYALATADGTSIVFGVKNGVFVITNDPDRADSLALDEPTKAAGLEGAIVVQADAAADRDQDPRAARRPDPGAGPAAPGARRAAGPADRLARRRTRAA